MLNRLLESLLQTNPKRSPVLKRILGSLLQMSPRRLPVLNRLLGSLLHRWVCFNLQRPQANQPCNGFSIEETSSSVQERLG